MKKISKKYIEENLGGYLSGKIPIPIPVQEIMDLTLKTLGDGSVCLGRRVTIVFDKEKLKDFFSGLSEQQKKLLGKNLQFFKTYMEPLDFIAKEISGKSKNFFDNIPRSMLALHVIFSIIESLTDTGSKKDFVGYLKDNFDRIKTKMDIETLSKEGRLAHPSNNVRCAQFYKKYLTKKEQEELVRDYKSWEDNHSNKFKNIEDVIEDIYGSMRSGFTHNLGYDHLRRQDFIFKFDQNDNLSAHGSVSIDRFLALSWEAIFRYFGFKFGTD